MSFFSEFTSKITGLFSLADQKYDQHDKQINLVEKVSKYECKDEVILFMTSLHSMMCEESKDLCKTSFTDLYSISENQLKKRELFLNDLEKRIENGFCVGKK